MTMPCFDLCMGHTSSYYYYVHLITINFQKITKKTDPVDSSDSADSDMVEIVEEQLQGDSYSLDDEDRISVSYYSIIVLHNTWIAGLTCTIILNAALLG